MRRTSAIRAVDQKDQRVRARWPLVTIVHELPSPSGGMPALVETQTYLLPVGDAANSGADDSAATSPTVVEHQHVTIVIPDETLLFQYSALGFNSHRIHLDREPMRARWKAFRIWSSTAGWRRCCSPNSCAATSRDSRGTVGAPPRAFVLQPAHHAGGEIATEGGWQAAGPSTTATGWLSHMEVDVQ